jgi:hypothetical protein
MVEGAIVDGGNGPAAVGVGAAGLASVSADATGGAGGTLAVDPAADRSPAGDDAFIGVVVGWLGAFISRTDSPAAVNKATKSRK